MSQAAARAETIAVTPDRVTMGRIIAERLKATLPQLQAMWAQQPEVRYFYIDDLLPLEWAQMIRHAFPSTETMTFKESLRERKYIAAQMDRYNPLLEEAIYAFQQPEVVAAVEAITGLPEMEPDTMLYAGGISLMGPGHFLNPHIDNSHDKFRQRYRILNLLYYVSPDWDLEHGGNLELWPRGPKGTPTTVVSRFNRLAVMITHAGSWHSVSPNRSGRNRCCVSNYYFSKRPIGGKDYFHVTSFRGRPEQPLRDLALRADALLRMTIRKIFPQGVKDTGHFYRKKT